MNLNKLHSLLPSTGAVKGLPVLALLLLPLSLRGQEASGEGPTMGWSSWNTYGVNINEGVIRSQATAMVSKGLKAVGYQYINIDDGYFGGRDPQTGHLLIHPQRFPNGLKGLVDFIHKLGLKAGIYSDAGRNTCGSMFSGDPIGKGVGLYEHDQQDADFFFKDLGFDFIKVDFCGGSWFHNEDHLVLNERERYTAIAQAIKNTGRTDVRMNACRWAYPGTWISNVAASWRTTGDINCSWGSVRGILLENLYLSAYCQDGHYNDMDMLEVGRWLSQVEDETHFGMWCIMASPLLIGCDMANLKPATLNLLKNKELIALNQDPLHLQAYVCQRDDSCYVLVKDIEQAYGPKRAFAVFNASDHEQTVTVDFAAMDLGGTIALRDCFKRRSAGTAEGTFDVTVPAHGTAIYTATATERLERTLYEAETAFNGTYQELANNQTFPSASFDDRATICSGGCKVGWLGNSGDNDLQWRNVYSPTGGRYKLTFGFVCADSRSAMLYVNGQRVQSLTGLTSGSMNRVGTRTVTVKLKAGENIVRLTNPSAWMPDMDYMKVELLEADGIGQLVPDAPDKAAAQNYYDLSGRAVSPQQARDGHVAGIYVTADGRKVLTHRPTGAE
ncbi:MAG: alpha-galactosidase [Bacteroidaceae bacterium]|nr:alpha-galactosidase [Bacteroidaceae bacterium]